MSDDQKARGGVVAGSLAGLAMNGPGGWGGQLMQAEDEVAKLREDFDIVLGHLRKLHEAHHELKAEVENLKRGGAA